jgi:hypothetical protein
MEELIIHGRLRYSQLTKDTYEMLKENHEIVVTEQEVGEEIEKKFREMVKIRLIVSVPYLEIQRRSLERYIYMCLSIYVSMCLSIYEFMYLSKCLYMYRYI